MADRILLIEDDPRLAEMVSEYLGEAGFRVSIAAAGRPGLERPAREPFDALLLDLMLPDTDGLDVCCERAAAGVGPVDRRARVAHPRRVRGGSEEAAPHRDRARSRLPVRQGTGLMRRLYLRIYLAVLARLAAFALAAGLLWRALGEDGPWSQAYEVAATLAQNALPPAGAPKTEQQAALEKLAANLRADVALFAPDRSTLAAVGAPLPAPETGRERGGWIHRWSGPAWAVRLPDGRWLEARAPRGPRHAPYGLFLVLALLALAVGVGAYPVVRRLTSRLERLQAGVESLGAGELSARVKVEGSDEVARLAESFNRAAGRIEELVGSHKSLLANASHELRTPLARIRIAVELMKENADPKRKAELEQDIAELDALIDEILLAGRLDALKGLETDEPVDLLALRSEERRVGKE